MKEKILLKSLELFSQKGFDAVSVSMISDGLGISKGALYKHYESKKAIFDAILRRMEDMDRENAALFHMPEGTFENMPEAYRNSSLEQLFSFTLAMFIYWTENEFASLFRKMISIERFSSLEMSVLYEQYLGSGPLGYVEDIFSSLPELNRPDFDAKKTALDFYAPFYMLISLYDSRRSKQALSDLLKKHMESFLERLFGSEKISYPRSEKYCAPQLMELIMGPNPIKLAEELMENSYIKPGSLVCDLGSGRGLSSVFLANEYGFKVYASDLWSDPEENTAFFESMGFSQDQIVAVKADAMCLPFEEEFFDAVISLDSYNYFGRDPAFLGEKLLPYVKKGGYIYIAVPGMKKDLHDDLPPELLISWNSEQLDFLHDKIYWQNIISQTDDIEIISISDMRSMDEVWEDWLLQDNEYAVSDRRSMEAGAGKYLCFVKIILRKK